MLKIPRRLVYLLLFFSRARLFIQPGFFINLKSMFVSLTKPLAELRACGYLLISLIIAPSLTILTACSFQNEQQPPAPYSDPFEPLPSEGLNILFIGNSLTYSNDLPGMLERMLLLVDIKVGHFESRTLPNFGLPDHWANKNTRDQMRRHGWDLAVLQQGPSATEGRPYLLEFAPLFANEMALVGAKTALYMVWPARQRFFDFAGVSDSYQAAASIINGSLFPAGEAWLEAWIHDPSISLYSDDKFHPSVLGTYLAALTMFEQITDLPLNSLPDYIPATAGNIPLAPELAEILKLSASEANRKFAQQPPIVLYKINLANFDSYQD
jgi:hypothetical protein